MTHEVMKPIYGSIVVVRKTFAYWSRGQGLFILAHIGANDGLLILFMLNGAQTSIIDRVGEQLGTLIRLLNILWHTVKTADVVLRKRSER